MREYTKMVSYSTHVKPLRFIKEQLRLYAFNGALPDHDILDRFQRVLSKHDRLAALLEGELNFHGKDSGYASHDLHSFAAKFPPQLPRAFIRGLTNTGNIVLDPMMGSGTTIVEAFFEGRQGIGLDIHPLAIRIGRIKTMALDRKGLRDWGYSVLDNGYELIRMGKGSRSVSR